MRRKYLFSLLARTSDVSLLNFVSRNIYIYIYIETFCSFHSCKRFHSNKGCTPDRACGRWERSRADVQLRHTYTVRLKRNGAGCLEELLVYDKYSMYVCNLYVCMYVTCMYVCMYVTCMYVCNLYVCMYVCMSVCLYVCMYICIYICIYIYMYIYIYIRIYIYTYILVKHHNWMSPIYWIMCSDYGRWIQLIHFKLSVVSHARMAIL